ncbi:MAG: 7-cyano-7-deazaguanine synthase QueC [Candidatus Hadarchaeales archaeon]
MKKAVCLISGGPDSATAAAVARKEGYDIYCLTFNYGQLASKEIESARKIAKALKAREHKIVDISFLKDLYGPGITALIDKNIPMPPKFTPAVIVPFRNGIMISIAVAYAERMGAEAIFYGPQLDDARFYPDCRRKFAAAITKAIQLGTERKIEVRNPLAKLPKFKVLKLAKELGVPLELTWSCYLNEKYHCGRCESCNNRKMAFEKAGAPDPTRYLNP